MARWRGTIAFEGIETGDHRMFAPGSITFRSLPRDFGCIFEDGSWGHENARVVGTIDTVQVQPDGSVYAEGAILNNDADAAKFANGLLQGSYRNVSIDVTAGTCYFEIVLADGTVVEEDGMDEEWFWLGLPDGAYERQVWTAAEIGSAVAARTCAFADALIELVPEEGAPAAGALRLRTGWVHAAGRAFTDVSGLNEGDEVTWTPDDGDVASATVGAVADDGTLTLMVNGEPTTVPAADAGSGDGQDGGAQATVEPRFPALAAYLARREGRERTVTASSARLPGAVLRASVDWDDGPAPEYFARLALEGPTPFTITDEGEVFGHVALFNQCHAGYLAGAARECIIAPESSPSNYAMYRANGQVRCSDGSRVSAGLVTMHTTHASAGSPGNRPNLSDVLYHYEHTGTIAAYAVAYADEYGIQVHGALRSGLSVDDVRLAMAARPSVDLRDYGDGLDLAGILLVNQPGWPVVEREDGHTYAVMASMAPRTGQGEGGAPPPVPATTAASSDCGCGNGDGGAATSQPTPAPSRPTPARLGQARLAVLDRRHAQRSKVSCP